MARRLGPHAPAGEALGQGTGRWQQHGFTTAENRWASGRGPDAARDTRRLVAAAAAHRDGELDAAPPALRRALLAGPTT